MHAMHAWWQLWQGASHSTQVRSLPVSMSRKYGFAGTPMFIVTKKRLMHAIIQKIADHIINYLNSQNCAMFAHAAERLEEEVAGRLALASPTQKGRRCRGAGTPWRRRMPPAAAAAAPGARAGSWRSGSTWQLPCRYTD